MRLIDTYTGEFVEIPHASKAPDYAILSHTWTRKPKGEQKYEEVREIQKRFRDKAASTSPPQVLLPGLHPSLHLSVVIQAHI